MGFAEGSKGGDEGDGSTKNEVPKERNEQSVENAASDVAKKADEDDESVVADVPAAAPPAPARMSDRGILRRGSTKTHFEAGGKRTPSGNVSHSSASFAMSHIASASSRPQHLHSASSEEESEAEADDEDSHSRRSRSPPRSYKRFPPLSKKQRKPAPTDRPPDAKETMKRKATMSIATRPLSVSIETPASSSNCGNSGDPSSLTVDRPPHKALSSECGPPPAPSSNTTQMTARTHRRRRRHRHSPRCLPTFGDPRASMWTSTHDANAPSEDRYSSLVNVMLRPPRSNERGAENASSSGSSVSGDESGDETTQMDEATQVDPRPHPDEEDNTSLLRMSLWSVIDGHGGGCVATYASEVLLPHIAASVARALNCTIVDRGVCTVNGQLRDANALDLDGLIRSSDRSKGNGNIDVVNPNSIHYRSPGDDSESEGEAGVDHTTSEEEEHNSLPVESEPPVSVASSLLPRNPPPESASSVKTSVKTAVSPVMRHAPVGTHSPSEVADITRAITDSFLSVDEGWINSIDPITTHQTACISNGRWNAGACALVVFTIQRLDWTRSSTADPETECGERGAAGGEDTSHNKDAARRRKLDYATKSKSVSSLSTLSSTSSLATVGPPTNVSVQESEITETEDDDDVSDIFGPRRHARRLGTRIDPHHEEGVVISTPGGCKCHYYRPHDAMLYTAHVGDCRAVMLGSAPPRTIKVRPEGEAGDSHPDSSDDYSSCDSSSGESEGLSSSDRDSDSSDGDDEVEEDLELKASASGSAEGDGYMAYMRRPAKRQCRRGASNDALSPHPPYVPLPPLSRSGSSSSEESEAESDDSTLTTALPPGPKRKTRSSQRRSRRDLTDIAQKLTAPDAPPPSPAMPHPLPLPPLPLSPLMRPIDLTTDHSAYNPAEVTAVLRRCNNAPRAISSASGGGIKRVAGSLAVTRALGDAYLKTPRLSFFPYKHHAPYITARPEVNCRLLSKGGDRVLILATDGVWERCTGDDVLRWVRNYYNERIAGVEKHHFRHRRLRRTTTGGHRHHHHHRRHGGGASSENRPLSVGPTASSADRNSERDSSAVAPAVSDGSLLGQVSDGNLSGHKRKRGSAASTTTHSSSGSSRGGWRSRHSSSHTDQVYTVSTVSDVIVRRVLNKVRRARNMPNLRALMELPKGRSRRSKHDDITASVVDMSGFIS